jgi:Beta-propeller repeat
MLRGMVLVCFLAWSVDAATQPLIDYVTYLGGSYAESAAGIAVDSTGAAYVAGTTASPDFPVTSTSLGAPSTNSCAFVTKFNPAGTAIDFSVCLANSAAIFIWLSIS